MESNKFIVSYRPSIVFKLAHSAQMAYIPFSSYWLQRGRHELDKSCEEPQLYSQNHQAWMHNIHHCPQLLQTGPVVALQSIDQEQCPVVVGEENALSSDRVEAAV